jgi:hypothetical protein
MLSIALIVKDKAYQMVIRPVSRCASDSWTLAKKSESALDALEGNE